MAMWSYVKYQNERILYVQMKEKKYMALYSVLSEKIRRGEYRPGERLPSRRVTADQSGYSLITVERAYRMLEEEGFVAARERCGYFVLPPDGFSACGNRKNADGTGRAMTGPEACVRLPEPREYPERDFPYSVWFRTVRRVISERGELLFRPSPGRGCEVLRNAIADYLLRYRGMEADPRRIVIGSGAEQLYESAARLIGTGRVYGVEDPCYGQILTAYRGMGCRLLPLPLGIDGIESSALESGGFDVLHVTPFYSYPSGITTSLEKRREYLRWGAAEGRYIVEDDFSSEFFAPGHPVRTLYSMDGRNRVLYINTFSKSLSPAVRIGYMILPPALSAVYEEILEGYSCSVPVMDQYVLAAFLSDGSFERHLNRIRRKMKLSEKSRKER